MGDPRSDRGSALVLVPAAVLVLVVLGAFAVDRAAVVAEQRTLVSIAQAAAADAASVSVDQQALHATGALRYDLESIDAAIHRAVEADAPDATVRWSVQGRVISVWISQPARLVFGPALDRSSPLTITAHATAVLAVRAP